MSKQSPSVLCRDELSFQIAPLSCQSNVLIQQTPSACVAACPVDGERGGVQRSCAAPTILQHISGMPTPDSVDPTGDAAWRLVVAAGKPVYAGERERILGQRAKQTERLAMAAARRSRSLALAYSASLATAYAIIAADTLQRISP